MPRGFWKGLLKLVLFLAAVAGIAIAVLRTWFVDVVTVAHNGMAPTMIIGDRVLLWRGTQFARNDIVLCRHPQDSSRWVMGRVAATVGSEISMDRGQPFIRDGRLSRDVRGRVDFTDSETGRTQHMVWGIEEFDDYEEHLFFEVQDRPPSMRPMTRLGGLYLLGDNRGHTGEDSRTFGVVQPSTCRGTIFMRLTAADGLPDEIPHGALDFLD